MQLLLPLSEGKCIGSLDLLFNHTDTRRRSHPPSLCSAGNTLQVQQPALLGEPTGALALFLQHGILLVLINVWLQGRVTLVHRQSVRSLQCMNSLVHRGGIASP